MIRIARSLLRIGRDGRSYQIETRGTTGSNQRRASRSMTKSYENSLFRMFPLFTLARHEFKASSIKNSKTHCTAY